MTQPALTKQIQSLEAQLGGQLFDRGRHGAVLTDLGRVLLPDARDVVRRAEVLAWRARQVARGEAGRLCVGFGMSSIELAPRAVAAFRRRYPDVDIVLDDMSSQTQIERLRAGELHVGFVRLPIDDDLERLVLREDYLAIASLASAEEHDRVPTETGELARWLPERRIVRLVASQGPGLAEQIERFRAGIGTRLDVVQEAHDLQTVLALVSAGVGIALVPASARSIAPRSVTITPIRHHTSNWQVAAVWRQADPAVVTANFLEVVREVA
ncbi:DNA-binding transcriptional LysR family regulator [Thermocatellispora tengchongensis]|uniref:DNA-binding transcriptional LysR family regulator n=1 Tax=Thermocatellispora tengchongensis TaxID=1073253 RepID=A0A840PFZ1_9ACTN|nr:DNA-binding transcriptional LysR family regulator [Thermocatellispora tengchongensis]